jgi:hypothetical protein
MRYAFLLAALILVAPSRMPAQKPTAVPVEEDLKRMTQSLIDRRDNNDLVWRRVM